MGYNQGIAFLNGSVSAGNDGLIKPLYHNNQGSVGQINFPQALVAVAVLFGDCSFTERKIFAVFKFPSCNHQQIARQNFCIAAGYHKALILPGYQHNQEIWRGNNIPQLFISPRVSFVHMDFNKAYIVFFLVIVKGLAHISVFINHTNPAGHIGQQGTLERHGQQHNAEHQIKEIVGKILVMKCGVNCKHNGSNAPQASPGHNTHLSQRGAEGEQNTHHSQRAQ